MTKFYLDGKKISKKTASGLVGEKRLAQMIEDAKETFMEDPYIENSWFVGKGILEIRFAL